MLIVTRRSGPSCYKMVTSVAARCRTGVRRPSYSRNEGQARGCGCLVCCMLRPKEAPQRPILVGYALLEKPPGLLCGRWELLQAGVGEKQQQQQQQETRAGVGSARSTRVKAWVSKTTLQQAQQSTGAHQPKPPRTARWVVCQIKPHHNCKYDCAHRVGQQQLRRHTPYEPAKVARVSHVPGGGWVRGGGRGGAATTRAQHLAEQQQGPMTN